MVVGGKNSTCNKDTIQRKNSNMRNNRRTYAKITILSTVTLQHT